MSDSGMSAWFLELLLDHGYDFFTGVPCSLLKGLISRLEADPGLGYVSAVREDSAIGLAVGAWLGGRQPVVLMQNSGLAVCTNALTSLSQIYDVPALLVVSWRGRGGKDAPEHLVMGRIMEDYLALLELPYELVDPARLDEQVTSIAGTMRRTSRPVALVVPEGVFE